MAKSRGLMDDQASEELGAPSSQAQRDRGTERVACDVGGCQVELLDEGGQVILVVLAEAFTGALTLAVSATVVGEDTKRFCETRRNGSPVEVVAPRTVDED